MTKTATAPRACADNCGLPVKGRKSTFLQGHDQRLVSTLATTTTYGELDAHWIERLGLSAGVNRADIQDRINEVADSLRRVFTPALAAKYVSAAHNRWAKAGRGTAAPDEPPAQEPQAPAEPERVKVKVGRWTYDGVIEARDEAGTPIAVTYTDGKGNEKTVGKFSLV
ncbi:hypothetical protein [Amycolatopsis albispora]|uniref:Uncharacterized protein n=1 Tax=Amycolatopsis albispora TaxID=1804986 RepID=A0A344LH04_9PSEU|nr:hypothetical protein [Amycolatopsis albispora]AXB47328.1 hypothetical protein A4R43_36785 [Amycolatopsis albispora]